MTKVVNETAYKPGRIANVVKVEVELMLDPVPGVWHDPIDFLNWVCTHNYVQSAKLVDVKMPLAPELPR